MATYVFVIAAVATQKQAVGNDVDTLSIMGTYVFVLAAVAARKQAVGNDVDTLSIMPDASTQQEKYRRFQCYQHAVADNFRHQTTQNITIQCRLEATHKVQTPHLNTCLILDSKLMQSNQLCVLSLSRSSSILACAMISRHNIRSRRSASLRS
jgi:hypothetical protein